jgi:hypothetical protein
MRIALVAPLAEAVPPKFYGGTERVVSWLAEELVRQGTGLLCSRAASRRRRPSLSCALRRVCGLREFHQSLHTLFLAQPCPISPVARTAPASFRRFISLGERGNHTAVP